MSPRPRKKGRKDWPEGLTSHSYKGKDGNVSIHYGWVDPRTDKERSLKSKDDLETAKKRARQLNALVAEHRERMVIDRIVGGGKTFGEWAEDYKRLLSERELAKNTIRTWLNIVAQVTKRFGDKPMLNPHWVSDIAGVLKEYTSKGKHRMAQSIRSRLIDMFAEAAREGVFPVDRKNPAEVTRNPTAKVKRARLMLPEFQAILKAAETIPDAWIANSMLLALVTAQRREDIGVMQFKRGRDWEGLFEQHLMHKAGRGEAPKEHPYPHVHDGFLWIVQQKRGKLIMIDLNLRMSAIGLSVGDVVSRCRDSVASRFLVHHTRARTMSKPGDAVHIDTISRGFARARELSGLEWPGEPPTFHENRSLSERLYKEQGVDTQALLGHSDARMTAVYHDVRGHDWVKVRG